MFQSRGPRRAAHLSTTIRNPGEPRFFKTMSKDSDDLETWKAIAKQPSWTHVYDRISLLSPILWWRCAAFKRISLQPLVHSLLAVVIPPTVAYCFSLGKEKDRSSKTLLTSTTTLQLIYGTWSLAWMYTASSRTLYPLVTTISDFVSNHSPTRRSAWQCLAGRITAGKAYRTSTYDVYLPPTSSPPIAPILFFSGASVEHVAYAEPAALLAEIGYLVVVVSAAPIHLVDMKLRRFWPLTLQCLQRTIEQKHFSTTDPPSWVLMGHSMGSFLCTKLAARLPRVSSIVLWGAAPFLEYVDEEMPQDMPTLVVQASNDVIISTFATPKAWKEFWRRFPERTVRYEIENGTHSGFGSYIPNFMPEVDGIPRDMQHEEAVTVTVDFLCGRPIT